MFQSPGEVAFILFGLPVYFYGIILAVAAFAGFYVSYFCYSVTGSKHDAEKIIDFAPILIIAGIAGARLYYCIVNYSYYLTHPLQILNIRQGGLSIHGMIIAGIIALWFCVKKYKLDFLKTLDCTACGTVLAQCIGRWGNFFNSEAFGFPTELPWKLFIPLDHRPYALKNFEYFHPAFLYESLADLLIFIILMLLLKKTIKYRGVIFGIYLVLYSLVRIGVEYLRVDGTLNIFGLPVAQWMSSLIIIAACIYIILVIYHAENP